MSGFRPISITPDLSKVNERLVLSRLCAFMETEDIFPRHQFAYRKELGVCDALSNIVFSGQVSLDRGRELAVVQIYFSADFDCVSHSCLLHKLRDVGVGGFFYVIAGFLSCRVHRVVAIFFSFF